MSKTEQQPLKNKNTAAEYIYSTMIPQSKAASAKVVPLSSFSRGKISMDLNLCSDDFDVGPTTGDDYTKPTHITSSDFVEKYHLSAPSRPAKMERMSTGESILREKMEKVSTDDWEIKDFKDESSIALKSLLGKPRPCMEKLLPAFERLSTADMDTEDYGNTPAGRMLSDMSSEWIDDIKGEQSADLVITPSLFEEKADSDRNLMAQLHPLAPLPPPSAPVTTAAAATTTTTTIPSIRSFTNITPSSTAKKTKKKKKKKRIIDEGHVCVPTDDDVLFGRGGYTNSHPGNVRFREKALELRQVYENSTKEEKFNISKLLLDSMTSEGARFLEKGEDGAWHKVVGNGARKKASQALRERIKGTRRPAHGSSLTSVQSANSKSPGSVEEYDGVLDGVGDFVAV